MIIQSPIFWCYTAVVMSDVCNYSGKGGTEKKDHEVTINLFKEIVPEVIYIDANNLIKKKMILLPKLLGR